MDDAVVRTKKAMMASARRSCLLVHHQRFERTALHKLANLDEFDLIITDAAPSAAAMAPIEAAGLTLTVAGERETPE